MFINPGVSGLQVSGKGGTVMATFMIGLAILVCGGFLYGSLCERVFGPVPAMFKRLINAFFQVGIGT